MMTLDKIESGHLAEVRVGNICGGISLVSGRAKIDLGRFPMSNIVLLLFSQACDHCCIRLFGLEGTPWQNMVEETSSFKRRALGRVFLADTMHVSHRDPQRLSNYERGLTERTPDGSRKTLAQGRKVGVVPCRDSM
jgi:hypothetical protein